MAVAAGAFHILSKYGSLIQGMCTDKMCYSTFCSKDQIYMQRYHGAHLEEEEGPVIMAVAAAAAF